MATLHFLRPFRENKSLLQNFNFIKKKPRLCPDSVNYIISKWLAQPSPSKGTLISKSHTFTYDIKYSSNLSSIYILMSLQLWYKMKKRITGFVTFSSTLTWTWRQPLPAALAMQFAYKLYIALYVLLYNINIFSDYSLWIGVTVLLEKSFTNTIWMNFKASH